MHAIYEPRGAALEYAPLAVNLYRGCSNGCAYCYAPACLRMSRRAFDAPAVRPGIIEAIAEQAPRLAGRGPILLCFTCDPYQALNDLVGLTGQAVTAIHAAKCQTRLLTKRPRAGLDMDGPLLRRAGVDFGVSLSWRDDRLRACWEPRAESVQDRLIAVAEAGRMGLRTWVSIEPVIEPGEALAAIDALADLADVLKIGKLNHLALAAEIDWRAFLLAALRLLKDRNCGYYVKADLWRAAALGAGDFPRERPCRR